jgi:hypothetical protein
MRAAAKVVLLVINTIWIILGLGMCAGGAYVTSFASQFDGLIDSSAIIVVAVVGAFLFLVGILGCVSVFKLGCKTLGLIYGVFLLILTMAMAGAGIAILNYLGAVPNTGVGGADAALAESRELIDNYINCMYNTCCVLNNGTTVTNSASSADAASVGEANSTLAKCDTGKSGTIQAGVCVSLVTFEIQDCSSSTSFTDTLTVFLNAYLTQFVIAVFGVAGVQFIGFIIACAFVFTRYTGGEATQVYAA